MTLKCYRFTQFKDNLEFDTFSSQMPKQRTTVEFLHAIKGVSVRTCQGPCLYVSRNAKIIKNLQKFATT